MSIAYTDFKNHQDSASRLLTLHTTSSPRPDLSEIKYCTFNGSPNGYGSIVLRSPGIVVSKCIFRNIKITANNVTDAIDQTLRDSIYYVRLPSSGDAEIYLAAGGVLDNNYFFYNQGNPHAFHFTNGDSVRKTYFTNNIIESTYEIQSSGSDPGNFCRVGKNDVDVKFNLFLDSNRGGLVSAWSGQDETANINIINNTCSMNGATSGSLLQVERETHFSSGIINVKNNVVHNYGASEDNTCIIKLYNGVSNQVDAAGFNGYFNITQPYYVRNGSTATPPEINPIGGDIDLSSSGTQFFDPSRKFSTFNGKNSAEEQIDTFLQINSTGNYNDITALIRYVKEGFASSNPILANSGEDGGWIGAIDPRIDAQTPVRPKNLKVKMTN